MDVRDFILQRGEAHHQRRQRDQRMKNISGPVAREELRTIASARLRRADVPLHRCDRVREPVMRAERNAQQQEFRNQFEERRCLLPAAAAHDRR